MLRSYLEAAYDLEHPAAAALVHTLAELSSPGLLNLARDQATLLMSDRALGLLLVGPDGTAITTPVGAAARIAACWSTAPSLSTQLQKSLDQAKLTRAVATAQAMLGTCQAAKAVAQPKTAPRPVSAPGKPVRYLSDEEKARLNAKYGQLKQPTAQDMQHVLSSGSNCKMQ